jgi:hypothetical protein
MSFLADKLHAMYRKYNEEQIPQFVLFVGHDWNLDAIQWVLKTPSGAWQRHMDPQSLQIKVLRGGGNFFISVSVNGSPVVIPGCAPAVGKGPAVHELVRSPRLGLFSALTHAARRPPVHERIQVRRDAALPASSRPAPTMTSSSDMLSCCLPGSAWSESSSQQVFPLEAAE